MNINLSGVATREFSLWLPGELEYSARKAGYDKKVARAKMPVDDPRSMYSFLGTEWHHAQMQHANGANYIPAHAKSAQLQLAKFASGLFDKTALGNWLKSDRLITDDSFVEFANQTAQELIELQPWASAEPVNLDLPFEQTPFSNGIKLIMQDISVAYENPDDISALTRLQTTSTELGSRAAATYILFAQHHLDATQQSLPNSELA